MKHKYKRRQIASTSIRNFANYIVAVAHASFIPVPDKWVPPKGLTTGVLYLISLLHSVTGAPNLYI